MRRVLHFPFGGTPVERWVDDQQWLDDGWLTPTRQCDQPNTGPMCNVIQFPTREANPRDREGR